VPKLIRSAGPIGLAISAYDVWRRLSPRQRKLLVRGAKRYGPLIAAEAMRSAKGMMRRRPPA
jgi:hypothetical protein